MYKRYSSVIPSSHILNEVQEVQPGTNRTEVSDVDRLDGNQSGGDGRRAFSRAGHTSAASKVQLRSQRTRQGSRPISMPLERLPAPVQTAERISRYTDAGGTELDPVSETIQEIPEMEKARVGGSSRVSTYYITPFIDTQTMQRRAWDKKYKHYDVTPRTAMIVANLPPNSCGVQPVKSPVPLPVSPALNSAAELPTTTSIITSSNTASPPPVWTKGENGSSSFKESRSSPNLPLTLRQPRTLQPPPGTFYKPPASITSRAKTLPTWTTTVTSTTNTTVSPTNITSSPSPTKPAELVSPSPPPTSPPQTRLQTQDSTDSAIDPGVSTSSTMSPPQSPPPSSPEDLSPGEIKPVYQRLRSRRLQELEQREAHFVWPNKRIKNQKIIFKCWYICAIVYSTDVFVIQPQNGSEYVPVRISQKVLNLLIYYILHVQVKVSPNHSEQANVLLFHVKLLLFISLSAAVATPTVSRIVPSSSSSLNSQVICF